jgi:hypothetical protein
MQDHSLVVTGSDEGGLTKRGALWENYTFTFEAQIVNECLGVVVRARDLDNYYMLQIARAGIQPHRQVAVATLQRSVGVGETDLENLATRLSRPLDGWFSVRVRVKGEAVDMYIDGNLVWQQESFLKNPTGKVGFRNYSSERALVRNVRVTLDE